MATSTGKRRVRRVQLACEAVSVLCPFCGEPQPSPDNGSDMWIRENFAARAGVFPCVACDEHILISSDPKAQFL